VHSIEYDGSSPATPWLVRTDDGQEWRTETEGEAALSLAAFVLGRDQDQPAQPAEPALPEGWCSYELPVRQRPAVLHLRPGRGVRAYARGSRATGHCHANPLERG
jgi:hypothetical protein